MSTNIPIKIQFVKSLSTAQPSRIVAVKADGDTDFTLYVTDKNGLPFPLKETSSGIITAIQNTDGKLVITGSDTKTINVAPALLSLINSALQAGDNVSELVNDANYITLADIPTFVANDYDLEDFTNISGDPFVRNSEITNGITNLGYTASPTNGVVTSDTGDDATIPLADNTNAGLLSSSEKAYIATALQPSDLAVVATTGDYGDLLNPPQTKAEFNTELTDGDFLFVGDITQYTDGQAQDAIGNILTDSTTIDFSYNDIPNTISAAIKPNSITTVELADDYQLNLGFTPENVANKQNSLAVDGTGTKYPTVDAVNAALPKTYATIVYVNTTSPTTSTVFDDENPPTVNDDVLKTNVANLYIGTDGSKWVYKTSPAGYVTEIVPDGSNFYLYNTTIDSGNNKTAFISRTGGIKTTGTLEGNTVRGMSLYLDGETTNTMAGFDGARQLKSLPTITYPSLTELSYVKGVTSGIQSQINGKQNTLTNPITGVVSNNTVPKSDGSGGLIDSRISDNGMVVGVGVNLEVQGGISSAGQILLNTPVTSTSPSPSQLLNRNSTSGVVEKVSSDDLPISNPTKNYVDTALSLKQTTLTNPTTGVGSQNDPNAYTLQDGTILYHSVKWFVPTGTVSTSGATVTSVGTQFANAMVGAKLTINGEWRIITAFTSATVVTVASAYSQDYSGVVAGNWGVYAKAIDIKSDGINMYHPNAGLRATLYADFSLYSFISKSGGYKIGATGIIDLAADGSIIFSKTNGSYNNTKDLGIRRNSAEVLEIYNGVTADGAIGNRRDLLARNYTGSATLTGTPTAPTAPLGTNTTQIATMAALYAATTTELAYALSDETANLTVSTRIKFRMPHAMTLSEVRISLNDAPTISSVIVDVKENGVSIFSTLLSIDANEKTSVTAAIPAVISDVNLADDAEITVSTTQIGSGDTGKGLKILFKGRKA